MLTPNTPPYLDIQNVTVHQGQTQVFNNLTLQLFKNQNTCILGPNGAGKTTLLKLLTRELYPVVKDNSFVKINGSETAIIWELRKKIGFVSQDLQNKYDAHIVGRDVVLSGLFGTVGLHNHFEVTQEHQDLTDKMLEHFQLTALQSRRYWHLSTGQQRNFLLARALIHKPEILILDEPTNGLDLKASHELIYHLQELAHSGTTLLLATHNIQEILPEFDRVLLLKEGNIIADGNKHEALTGAKLSWLYDTPIQTEVCNGFHLAYPGQRK